MTTTSAKTLRNYLGSSPRMRLLGLGLLILAIAAFVAGITLTGKQGDPSKAVEFYPAEDVKRLADSSSAFTRYAETSSEMPVALKPPV